MFPISIQLSGSMKCSSDFVKSPYQEQVDLLNEEIALVDLEIYETKLEEWDLDAALNFATNALSSAAKFWTQCSAQNRSRDSSEFFSLMV